MNKKIEKKDNFLELVPKKNEKFDWEVTDNGLVQVIIPRKGILDRIVRVFLKTPTVMRIDLDKYGSYIWNLIDGNRTTGDISKELKLQFGDEIEPLYERLITYINILRNNKFIIIEK